MAPAPPVALVGRDAERAAIVDALAADRVVLVTGEAGIGKTTLVRAAVAAAGRTLIHGAGFATLATMPYLALRLALGSPVAGSPADVARRVEAAVGDGVLFLDDLQWLDHETQAVLALLPSRIGLVVASRDRTAVLDAVPAGLVTHVRLGPLDAEAAAVVARGAAEGLAEPALHRILRRAGGNPLLLEELARDGRESASVARALAGHLAEASLPARHALQLLAVADRPVAAAPFAGVEEELAVLGLAVRTGGGLLAIRHALIADALLDELGDTDRRTAHREVAELVDDDIDAALHLARGGEPAAAVARATAALGRTTDLRRRAALLRVAAESATGPGAPALRLEAARAALAVDDAPSAVAVLGGPDVEDATDVEARGLHLALLGRALGLLGRRDEALAALARCGELRLDPSGEAASLLAVEEAVLAANAGALEQATAILEEADANDASGDPARKAGRDGLLAILVFLGGGRADLRAMRRGVDAAIAEGLPAAAGRAANLCSVALGTSGPVTALTLATEYAARLESASLDAGHLQVERIQCLTLLGRAAEAVVAADEILERPTPFSRRAIAMVHRTEALCQLGRLADAEATLLAAEPLLSDDWGDRGEADTTRAHLAFWSGRPREAIAAAEAALARPSHYAGNYLLPGLIRAWAQVDLGLRPAAPVSEGDTWAAAAGRAEWGALDALAESRPAVERFDAAADAWEGAMRLRSLLCRWGAGEAARRQGDGTAIQRLRSALTEAEASGFEPLAARIRRSLRLAGERPLRPAAPTAARGLLTPREREILALVAAGRSNAEIGRQMGLGRGTVIRLLSSSMSKLGATSRAQAVTLATATEIR